MERKPFNPLLADGRQQTATKVCRHCGRELPVTDFPYRSDGLYRLGVCKDCRVSRSDMKAYDREMVRRHRAKRASNPETPAKTRRPNGQGDRHEYFAKMYAERKDEIKAKQVLGKIEQERKRKAAPKEKLCKKCWLYPCFEGIDNLETDFAKEGCISFHERKE